MSAPANVFGGNAGTLSVTPSGNLLTLTASRGPEAAGAQVQVCLGDNCLSVTLGPTGTARAILTPSLAQVSALPSTGAGPRGHSGSRGPATVMAMLGLVLLLGGAAAWQVTGSRRS